MSGNIPISQQQQNRVRLNWPATVGFFSICAFAMLNMNFFTRTFLKTEQVLSVFYLLACLTVLIALKFPISKSIGSVGILWMAMIGIFLAISTRGGLGVESRFFTSFSSDVYRILNAQLITIAAAVGARHLYLAGKLQMTLRIAFGLTLLAGLTIILSKIFPILAVRNMQGRVGGVFTDANAAGHALCYSAAIGFACIVNEKSLLIRTLLFAGLTALIPCLLLTNSRSSILFMGLLVISQFFISPLLKRKGTLVAILVLAIGVPVGITIAANQRGSNVDLRENANVKAQQERLASLGRILRGEMEEGDTGHRFVVWGAGLRYFITSPVIGVGFFKLTNMPEFNLGCHNTFIRVLGEGGIFCGFLYVFAVASVALAGWRCKVPEVRCLVLGFILSYACSALVAHTVLTARIGNVILGICLGFLTGAASIASANAKRRRTEVFYRQQQLQAERALTTSSA